MYCFSVDEKKNRNWLADDHKHVQFSSDIYRKYIVFVFDTHTKKIKRHNTQKERFAEIEFELRAQRLYITIDYIYTLPLNDDDDAHSK